MGAHHPHLEPELRRWVADGLIPPAALLAPAMASRGVGEEERARWAAAVERSLRRGKARRYLAVAAGLLTVAEAAPQEWEEAKAALAKLRDLPVGERAGRLRRYTRLLGEPALFDLLLAEARDRVGDGHRVAGGWLRLAGMALVGLQAAERLPRPLVIERALRLTAYQANLLRVRGDLPQAAQIFAEIEADPRRLEVWSLAAHAERWSLEGSNLTASRHFETSAQILERAELAFRALDQPVQVARVLMKQGSLAEYSGESGIALRIKKAVLGLLNRDLHPKLYWSAQHNLAGSLLSLGRPTEAAVVAAAAQNLFNGVQNSTMRMRTTWLEGRIARALLNFPHAEEQFLITIEVCDSKEQHFNGALARLDLAELYLAFGKAHAVKPLAQALVESFLASEVHREAHAAAIVFARAAAAEKVTPEAITELWQYFNFAWLDPSYRYVPAPGSGIEG